MMKLDIEPTSDTSAAGDSGLTVRGLCKTYAGGVKALDHVDLDVPEGMFGLLGPNGAGKSTLMRTIAALQTPDAGTVRFRHLDVHQTPQELRKILGYLPQDFGVYPYLTAPSLLEHLAMLKGLSDKTTRRATVEDLLHRVNLWDHRKKRLGTFSGGMRQRFGIAQALIGDPKLIIVDEPTAGLDPEERARCLNLLGEIGDRVVVILSTHIVDDVADLCPKMAILAQGKILATDTPHLAIDALRGQVYEKTVAREELAELEAQGLVTCKRLFAGQTIVHIHTPSAPPPGFHAVDPDLTDVYFTTLKHPR